MPTPMPQAPRAYRLALTALSAAALCVAAPFSLPVGPVPISLATLVIYLSLYLLGGRRTAAAVGVYLALGLVGLPVFSGFAGGPGRLLGPTGGYLLGYLPLALLAGRGLALARAHARTPACARALQWAALAAGTAACYAFGTAWFCVVMAAPLPTALAACVLPFLPGDLAKMLLTLHLGPVLQRRLPHSR